MQARSHRMLRWLCRTGRPLQDALRVAVAVLEHEGAAFGQGSACAFEDAAWLLLWSLDLPRDRLDDFRSCQMSVPEMRRFARLLRRRVEARLPVAYLTAEAWLHGLSFHADRRALIPRSLLVEALAWCAGEELLGSPARILDLCTGSGSILVHAAMRYPQAILFGSDISEGALALARDNLHAHGVEARCELRCGSGLEPWIDARFDLLLCNPPYVTDAGIEALPPEFLAEPQVALDGGPDGMRFCRQWLPAAGRCLAPGGSLLLEIGRGAEHFARAFPGLEPLWVPVEAGPHMVMLFTQSQLCAYFAEPGPGGADDLAYRDALAPDRADTFDHHA